MLRGDGAWRANSSGRIDILVNNVGGTIWAKPYAHYEEAEIEAEIRRSLFPTLWCCRAVLPYMLEQKRGVIVNVSSVATRGINRVPYAAAKGGVNALTASLALEYAEQGIRVCATAPRRHRGAAAQDPAQRRAAERAGEDLVSADRRSDEAVQPDEALRHASRNRPRRSCSSLPTRRPTSPASAAGGRRRSRLARRTSPTISRHDNAVGRR